MLQAWNLQSPPQTPRQTSQSLIANDVGLAQSPWLLQNAVELPQPARNLDENGSWNGHSKKTSNTTHLKMQLQGLTDHHHEESAVQTWQWDICAIELVTIVMTIIQVSLVWFGVAHGMISLTPVNFIWFLKLTWASLLTQLVPPGVAPEPWPQHGRSWFHFQIYFFFIRSLQGCNRKAVLQSKRCLNQTI